MDRDPLPAPAVPVWRRRWPLLLAAAVAVVLAVVLPLTLTGGAGGHSASWKAGYADGGGLSEQSSEDPGMVSGNPSSICHQFARTMADGSTATTWIAGCIAAISADGVGNPGYTTTG